MVKVLSKMVMKVVLLFLFILLSIFGSAVVFAGEQDDVQKLQGMIKSIKKNKLGCSIDVKAKAKVYKFFADYDYCMSSHYAVGKFVKVEWKMKKIDDCDGGGYGCGKYADRKVVLYMEGVEF